MEPSHHYRSKSVGAKRPIDVLRSPSATVCEVSHRHDGFDELAFKPFLDVFDDFTSDGGIASGIKLFIEKLDQVSIASKIPIRLDQISMEGITDDLSGDVFKISVLPCALDL